MYQRYYTSWKHVYKLVCSYTLTIYKLQEARETRRNTTSASQFTNTCKPVLLNFQNNGTTNLNTDHNGSCFDGRLISYIPLCTELCACISVWVCSERLNREKTHWECTRASRRYRLDIEILERVRTRWRRHVWNTNLACIEMTSKQPRRIVTFIYFEIQMFHIFFFFAITHFVFDGEVKLGLLK